MQMQMQIENAKLIKTKSESSQVLYLPILLPRAKVM